VAVALTGIIATVPYVALQLAGMQVVIAAMGIPTTWTVAGIAMPNLPLIVAFAVLAAYTYASGLRGTALTAIVKDILIYVTVITAVIVIPAKLGGYGRVFAEVNPQTLLLPRGTADNLGGGFAYSSLAVGSMLALFLYPHAVTGLLGAGSRQAIKRNAIILPAYSLALALLALLGYVAVAAGIRSMPEYAAGFATFGNNFAIPALFLHSFPSWFTGVAFAAIAIGALVPASIMAIASGSLFTRNVYKEFISPDCSPAQEARVAKLASLALKVCALAFVLMLQTTYAIQLQLLGGIWICQTLPAVLIALCTRFFHPYGLLSGWAVGVAAGTYMAWTLNFKSSIYVLHIFGVAVPCYAAVSALVLNIAVALVVSVVLHALSDKPRVDETSPADYL
jgi:SSS family solute:Na+ symporter